MDPLEAPLELVALDHERWRQADRSVMGVLGQDPFLQQPFRRGSRGARRGDQRWRQWVARAAVTSGLSRMLGARHSAYMRRMLQMFDEGELDEALRHALPIGGDEGSLGQAFSAPGRRDDLSVATRRGPSSSIGLTRLTPANFSRS